MYPEVRSCCLSSKHLLRVYYVTDSFLTWGIQRRMSSKSRVNRREYSNVTITQCGDSGKGIREYLPQVNLEVRRGICGEKGEE